MAFSMVSPGSPGLGEEEDGGSDSVGGRRVSKLLAENNSVSVFGNTDYHSV